MDVLSLIEQDLASAHDMHFIANRNKCAAESSANEAVRLAGTPLPDATPTQEIFRVALVRSEAKAARESADLALAEAAAMLDKSRAALTQFTEQRTFRSAAVMKSMAQVAADTVAAAYFADAHAVKAERAYRKLAPEEDDE